MSIKKIIQNLSENKIDFKLILEIILIYIITTGLSYIFFGKDMINVIALSLKPAGPMNSYEIYTLITQILISFIIQFIIYILAIIIINYIIKFIVRLFGHFITIQKLINISLLAILAHMIVMLLIVVITIILHFMFKLNDNSMNIIIGVLILIFEIYAIVISSKKNNNKI